MKERNVAVNLIVPGHTRTTGSDEQAAARQSLGGGSGALSLRPDHVVPLAPFLARQNAGGGPTGRCFDTVAWNIEHGLGRRRRSFRLAASTRQRASPRALAVQRPCGKSACSAPNASASPSSPPGPVLQ